MKKPLFLGLFALVIILVLMPIYQYVSTVSYDIVVYGGGWAGCASARSAAWSAPEKEVLLIVPEPVPKLGGLGTVGGQNFADIRYWQGKLVTAGSFQRWFEESGQFYNTNRMAEIISQDLAQFPNLTVLYQHDIKKVTKRRDAIKSLSLAPVQRDAGGNIEWSEGQKKVRGTVFVDASDDGRLARLSGSALSVGRQDWPLAFLPEEEAGGKWARQQAATLMFKVKGVKKPEQTGQVGDFNFVTSPQGCWAMVGGKETWQKDSVVENFNKKYGAQGFAIKPINAAQDGADSDEWWVNMLLVFDVDGRAQERDRGTDLFPEMGAGQRTVDQAWKKARELLQKPDFLETLRRFKVEENNEMYGFGEASLVMDDLNKPVVGEIMYIRETVHALMEEKSISAGGDSVRREDKGYALTTKEVQKAGRGTWDGEDRDNYKERIGLGYYMMDINAFRYEDILQDDGYVWPVTGYLRPDWVKEGGEPHNPVYLPYSMLTATGSDNLLVPGNATGCSSFAWAEIRVLPNIAVLGDAAGVSAARAVLYEEKPASFESEQIKWVQEKLLEMGARLDK